MAVRGCKLQGNAQRRHGDAIQPEAAMNDADRIRRMIARYRRPPVLMLLFGALWVGIVYRVFTAPIGALDMCLLVILPLAAAEQWHARFVMLPVLRQVAHLSEKGRTPNEL